MSVAGARGQIVRVRVHDCLSCTCASVRTYLYDRGTEGERQKQSEREGQRKQHRESNKRAQNYVHRENNVNAKRKRDVRMEAHRTF